MVNEKVAGGGWGRSVGVREKQMLMATRALSFASLMTHPSFASLRFSKSNNDDKKKLEKRKTTRPEQGSCTESCISAQLASSF